MSAALIGSTIFGVAPASAAVTELPPTANGVNNSGIRLFACEDRLIYNIPKNLDRPGGLTYEGKYNGLYLHATAEGTTKNISVGGGIVGRIQDHIRYESKNPGETVELDIAFTASGESMSDTVTVEATVVDSDAFAGGNGTRKNPYLISNVDQLNLVRCHDHKNFKLTKNLNLAGIDWMPIGNYNDSFDAQWFGNFNGAGKTISNLTIEDNNLSGVGLFGSVYRSAIYDLTLLSPDVAGEERVGALTGDARHSTFSEITVKDAKILGNNNVGGLIGRNDYRSVVTKISVTSEVIGRSLLSRDLSDPENYYNSYSIYAVGGAVGYEDGDGSHWDDISVNANLSFEIAEDIAEYIETRSTEYLPRINYVGGFAGETGDGSSFKNVRVKSKMTVDTGTPMDIAYVGGFGGDMERMFTDQAVSDFTMNAKGANNYHKIGGFVGYAQYLAISNASSVSKMNLEIGEGAYKLGGFVADGYDAGFHDIRSKSSLNMVAVEDEEDGDYNFIGQIGGFIGHDQENNISAIHSDVDIKLVEGNGSNNSLGANVDIINTEVSRIGGFVGDRDDYTSLYKINSHADVVVTTSVGDRIGGFVGHNRDNDAYAIRDAVLSGSVRLAENIYDAAALFGKTGPIHLQSVISSIALKPNGADENVGYLYGDLNTEDAIEKSHFRNVFFNGALEGAAAASGVNMAAKKLKTLTSSKFLAANGFDLENVYDHVEGKLPMVKINAPFPDGMNVKTGQSNNDTSISFGLRLSDGSRNFFVNLKNIYARQVATLQVVRAGKVVKTINSQVTNGVGNWFVNSKFKIKTGDVLRVKVAGKQISTLTVK